MKKIMLCGLLALLTSCDGNTELSAIRTDQCLRREIFMQCLKTLPAGPKETLYNDWAEVIAECGDKAFYMSRRSIQNIKPECRAP